MIMSEFQHFLLGQCAICSLNSENSDLTNTHLSSNQDEWEIPEDFNSNGISNAEAISQIYGISKTDLGNKLFFYFMSIYKSENILSLAPEEKSELIKMTEFILCKRCSPVVASVFKFQKQFNSAINEKSLISKALGILTSIVSTNPKTLTSIHSEIKTEALDLTFEDNDESAGMFGDLEMDNRETSNKIENSFEKNKIANCFKTHFVCRIKGEQPVKRKKHTSRKKEKLVKQWPNLKELSVSVERLENTGLVSNTQNTHVDPSSAVIKKLPSTNESRNFILRKRKSDAVLQNEFPDYEVKLESTDTTTLELRDNDSWCSDEDFDIADACSASDDDISSDASFASARKSARKKERIRGTKTKSALQTQSDSSRKWKAITKQIRLTKPKMDLRNSKDRDIKKTNRTKIEYDCKECGLNFPNAVNFYSHKAANHSTDEIIFDSKATGPPFICPICSKSRSTLSCLRIHCSRIHNLKLLTNDTTESQTKNPIKCSDCDLSFTTYASFVSHSKRIHNHMFPSCNLCQKLFTSQNELDIHMTSYHSNEKNEHLNVKMCEENHISFQFSSEPYYCRQCNLKFNSRGAILTHNRYCHANVRIFDCKNCNHSSDSPGALIAHLLEVHNEVFQPEKDEDQCTCLDCGNEYFSYGRYQKHKKETGHKQCFYKCTFCSETFTNISDLRIHKRIEHKEKYEGSTSVIATKSAFRKMRKKAGVAFEEVFKSICHFCVQQFANEEECEQHQKMHSEDERKISKCDKCAKTFSSRGKLKLHWLHLHLHSTEKEKPGKIECNHCGKFYASKKSLRTHMKQHLGVENKEKHICHICGNSFKAISYLKKHINVRHLGKEVTQCDQCGYIARTKWDVTRHMLVHEKNGLIRKRVPRIEFQQDVADTIAQNIM